MSKLLFFLLVGPTCSPISGRTMSESTIDGVSIPGRMGILRRGFMSSSFMFAIYFVSEPDVANLFEYSTNRKWKM